MKGQFGGYDLSYQLDANALLEALQSSVVDGVASRLQSLQFAVPLDSALPNLLQFGTLQAIGRPQPALSLPAINDASAATLTILFENVILSLQAVPAAGSLLSGFAGLAAFPPTSIGAMTISANIKFSSTPQAPGALVELGLAASLPPGAAPGAQQPLVAATVPDLAGLGNVTVLNLPQNSLADAVEAALAAAVQAATAPIYAVPFPMTFAAPNACGIGVRSLDVTFLAASPTTSASLGFFMTLLEQSSGTIADATTSSVSTTGDFALALSNTLLKTIVCCAFQNSSGITGLGPETQEDAYSCTWLNVANVGFGSQKVTVNKLEISVTPSSADSTFTFYLQVEQSGWGWQAYATVDITATPYFDGTDIQSAVHVSVSVSHDVSWWAYVIAGILTIAEVIALIVAAPLGVTLSGGIVALVADLIVGILYGVGWITSKALGDATNALQGLGIGIVPVELPLDFGGPSDLKALTFDDLIITAAYAPPASAKPLNSGSNVVLGFGDRIDLDSGTIQRGSATVPGFGLEGDLLWEALPPENAPVELVRLKVSGGNPVTGEYYRTVLSTLGSARLLPLGGESFWSISENALATLAFPAAAGTLDGSNFVVSGTPYPAGAYVFAVLTTERHLAKCVAWRDASSYLHLSYVTYANAVPLSLTSTWTATQGPFESSSPLFALYQASWTGTVRAQLNPPLASVWYEPPTVLQWLWNGTPLAAAGELPGASAAYTVSNDGVGIVTAMGQPLPGVLQAVVQKFGTTFEYSLDVDQPGTVRVSLLTNPNPVGSLDAALALPAPEPAPTPPLATQLASAFATGMHLPPGSVAFK